MRGFRDRFYQFFEGRYGMRALSDTPQFVLAAVYLVLVLINMFARSRVINAIELVFIGITLFRMFSKDIPRREREHQKTREILFRWRDSAQNWKQESELKKQQRAVQKERKKDKEHVYRECPTCGATLRLPNRKGKHTVRCPRCGHDFSVKV